MENASEKPELTTEDFVCTTCKQRKVITKLCNGNECIECKAGRATDGDHIHS